MKKQKGTGTARAGSAKSPLFVGGGIAFGSAGKKNYTLKVNKSVSRKARFTAISSMVRDQKLLVIEDFSFEKPETKKLSKIFKDLNLNDQTLLFVINPNTPVAKGDSIYLSSRNIPGVNVSTPLSLNTYEIVRNAKILFSESALNSFQEKYLSLLGLSSQ